MTRAISSSSLRGAHEWPFLHPTQKVARGHRSRDVVALRDIAAELLEQLPVGSRFDSLCDRFDIEASGHLQTGGQDDPCRFLPFGVTHERLVDFELGERYAAQL